jgi:protein gp37
MAKTKIDWADESINPFTGCRGSCPWCYARRMARRLASMPHGRFQVNPYRRVELACDDCFETAVHLDVLKIIEKRLARSGKRRVFVGSMGDMCFGGTALTYDADGRLISDESITGTRELQHEMARFTGSLDHTFLFLTKRPDLLIPQVSWHGNVHLGVSVTSNHDAHRVTELLERRKMMTCAWSPDVVLWASVEPLLDPGFNPDLLDGLDWVVVGLQTGPGAPAKWTEERKQFEDAAHRVVEWCEAAEVPVFVKDNVKSGAIGWPRQLPVKNGSRP